MHDIKICYWQGRDQKGSFDSLQQQCQVGMGISHGWFIMWQIWPTWTTLKIGQVAAQLLQNARNLKGGGGSLPLEINPGVPPPTVTLRCSNGGRRKGNWKLFVVGEDTRKASKLVTWIARFSDVWATTLNLLSFRTLPPSMFSLHHSRRKPLARLAKQASKVYEKSAEQHFHGHTSGYREHRRGIEGGKRERGGRKEEKALIVRSANDVNQVVDAAE